MPVVALIQKTSWRRHMNRLGIVLSLAPLAAGCTVFGDALTQQLPLTGFAFHDEADIQSGYESVRCSYVAVPGAGPVWVDSIAGRHTGEVHDIGLYVAPVGAPPPGTIIEDTACSSNDTFKGWPRLAHLSPPPQQGVTGPMVMETPDGGTATRPLPQECQLEAGTAFALSGGQTLLFRTRYINALTTSRHATIDLQLSTVAHASACLAPHDCTCETADGGAAL
jgi:hypothetical protein